MNTNNSITYSEENNYHKYYALSCSHCLFPIEYFEDVDEKFFINATSKLNKYKIYGMPRLNMFVQSHFGIEKCPNCGAEYSTLINIDYKIAPMIYQLNLKGYKTRYCCSGHDQEYEYYVYNDPYPSEYTSNNRSYIMFNNIDVFKKYIVPNLPDKWKSDGELSISSTRILGDPFNGYTDPNDPGYQLIKMIDKLPILIGFNNPGEYYD